MPDLTSATLTDELWDDARTIWNHLRLDHPEEGCDAAIGLGSHDLGVAVHSTALYHRGLFPIIVFTGSNSATTKSRFPRGEAVHYREYALAHGVPDRAVLTEAQAANTGENIAFSRAALARSGTFTDSVLLVCKPYMERRAFATCRQLWPEVKVVCASQPLELHEYVEAIGDVRLVVDMLVGELHRLAEYPRLGHCIAQEIPPQAKAAYDRLAAAGFNSRLLRFQSPSS
jgi:hypothetical protein